MLLIYPMDSDTQLLSNWGQHGSFVMYHVNDLSCKGPIDLEAEVCVGTTTSIHL